MNSSVPNYNYTNQEIALIGYGVTGKACADFLLAKGALLTVFDKSFSNVKKLSDGLSLFPLISNIDLSQYDLVVVSPGVDLRQPFIQQYIRRYGQKGRVIGDIELFARELNYKNAALDESQKPTRVIAITGSNGKSTVVDMLAQAFTKLGVRVALGGNFGTPALSFLMPSESTPQDQNIDIFILELSSFQLESTFSLSADVACIMNVTCDHLDRHGNMDEYTRTKQQIYVNAAHTVFNLQDDATRPPYIGNSTSFGLCKGSKQQQTSFYQTKQGIYRNDERVLDIEKFPVTNQFQLLNIQVVMACAHILQFEISDVLASLATYKGLAHRFETVLCTTKSVWINDSKATNPGATVAAIESLAEQVQHIVLIAGGDAKGSDMQSLSSVVKEHVNTLVLLGKDADLFTHFGIPFKIASSIEQAVTLANSIVLELGSTDLVKASSNIKTTVGVLLSPACASIDMYSNYQERGKLFSDAVIAQVA